MKLNEINDSGVGCITNNFYNKFNTFMILITSTNK